MTTTDHTANPAPSLAVQAEEVRAYVVEVRGGAPFLSAADGRLLVGWLEGGVSVARILAAVDEVAEKRRKKRTRGRLSLTACRRSIEGKKGAKTSSSPAPQAEMNVLAPFADDLEHMEIDPIFVDERTKLVSRIRRLDAVTDPDALATEAVAAVRAFHEATWTLAAPDHARLRTAARQELSALSSVLSAEAFEAAIDEVARDLLRRRVPLVSAAAIWDRLSPK